MRENAENASSLTNRTSAKSVWRRRIAALVLAVVGAFFSETATRPTASAQTRQTTQTASSAQARQNGKAASSQVAADLLKSANLRTGANAAESSVEGNEENGSDGGLSPEAVRSGVDGAIAFLRQKQKPNGEWDEYPGYRPGTTALCALSLLSAGLDKDDPTVAKALEFLRGFSPQEQNQTYPISLQTMVFCLADPETDRARIEANVAWLVERQLKTSNEYDGGWSYVGIDQASERADNSNSQFALLALYEAEQIGVAIDEAVWKRA
ncbi:MAG: terpene cyclase/mutase family protein, partial [Thermoguttaceae bacterium]|nr:terpene cyclase/mutase family protein [Thermoguttaceae bacterium]